MKASEARQLTENGDGVNEEELQRIYTVIKMKASLGASSTSINENQHTRAIKLKLEEDGYRCEYTSDRNESILLIRW